MSFCFPLTPFVGHDMTNKCCALEGLTRLGCGDYPLAFSVGDNSKKSKIGLVISFDRDCGLVGVKTAPHSATHTTMIFSKPTDPAKLEIRDLSLGLNGFPVLTVPALTRVHRA